MPDMLSRDPRHVFSPQEIDDFNTGTMLPPNLFALIQGSYSSFRKEVLLVQRLTKLGKELLSVFASGNKPRNAAFSVSHDNILHKGNLWILVPRLQTEILQATHNHPLSGHPGRDKLMELVQRDFSWPGMRPQVKKLLDDCVVCARVKPSNEKPAGLLKPLQHPSGPWLSLSVDFITSLPRCEGFDAIIVVVVRFTKMAEFFPFTSTLSPKDTAQIFIREIFARHGLPEEIVSGWGPQFVSKLWTHFLKGLQIKPCLSSGYHPQSDGQTERVNMILEKYLCCFVPACQDDWVSWLRVAQFAYNNSTHASISLSPFQITMAIIQE